MRFNSIWTPRDHCSRTRKPKLHDRFQLSLLLRIYLVLCSKFVVSSSKSLVLSLNFSSSCIVPVLSLLRLRCLFPLLTCLVFESVSTLLIFIVLPLVTSNLVFLVCKRPSDSVPISLHLLTQTREEISVAKMQSTKRITREDYEEIMQTTQIGLAINASTLTLGTFCPFPPPLPPPPALPRGLSFILSKNLCCAGLCTF